MNPMPASRGRPPAATLAALAAAALVSAVIPSAGRTGYDSAGPLQESPEAGGPCHGRDMPGRKALGAGPGGSLVL
jgi:hypothetical protein